MTEHSLSTKKLNLGCGGRPLKGYINVDMDTLEQMRIRYPNHRFDDDICIQQYDIFNLPFEDASIDEVRSEGLIEHLPFIDEPKFFNEVVRVLKPGALLYLSTVDFETAVRQWLVAEDNWIEFFKNDPKSISEDHWFGTHTYAPLNRWGYLTATIYGSQNGDGQFHTNCYSEAKLRAICLKMGLSVVSVERFQWKGNRDWMLGLTAIKEDVAYL
jgi:predicted SAM-dependent methyltransferase